MITASADTAFAALARRLEERARVLAEARRRETRFAPDDPRRWRNAGLLWPHFAKG